MIRDARKPEGWRGSANRACFTLIEILLVLAIVSIMAAFLVPALSQARDRARRIICLNNMRQIGIGMYNYAIDHEGHFPTYHPASITPNDLWWYFSSPAGSEPHPFELLSNYVKHTGVLFCPSAVQIFGPDANPQPWGQLNKSFPSYSFREYMNVQSEAKHILVWEATWYFPNANPTCQFAAAPMESIFSTSGQFRSPFYIPLGWGIAWAVWDPDQAPNAVGFSQRPCPHSIRGVPQGSNIMFVDGRVEWRSGDKIGPFYSVPESELWGMFIGTTSSGGRQLCFCP